MTTTYTVETLRSGQPRAYADTEREYLITVKSEHYSDKKMRPWVMHGDVEDRIAKEEAMRAEGRMSGGQPPDALRKSQRDWAKKVIRGLCQGFREKDDDDGRTGMDAYFYPTLKWLKIDAAAGTIHALIIEPYTD